MWGFILQPIRGQLVDGKGTRSVSYESKQQQDVFGIHTTTQQWRLHSLNEKERIRKQEKSVAFIFILETSLVY